MIVRLPKETRGKELFEIIKKAAKTLESDNFFTSLDVTNRYEPGSLKVALHSFEIEISKRIWFVKKHGFLWRKKEMIETWDYPLISFLGIFSDNTYKELNIIISKKSHLNDHDFNLFKDDAIRPVFEKLIANIYEQLGAPA